MSGICALVSLDGSPPGSDIERMVAAALHRAPDGNRQWRDSSAALAHLVSLLTPADSVDKQPNERGGLVLVADARIDNREELVPSLVRAGYLAGAGEEIADSDVILAAHRYWGTGAPERLIGDFAYVLWDRLRGRVVAARDVLGMRPLYFRFEGGRRALFASELKQLLSASNVPCEVDERAVAATLAGPYLPAAATVYAGIQQLPPGHFLTADADGMRVRPYWAPDPGVLLDLDLDDVVTTFRERLTRAVADRLRTTRPVGLFLSGGMDSGSIASVAGSLRQQAHHRSAELRTYSWAFTSVPGADERDVSDLIVDHYGLPAIAVPGDEAWPLAGYPEYGPDRDDPYTWVYQALHERTIARCAEDGVGLVLLGDRGDELVGDWIYDELGLLRAGKISAAVADLRLAWRWHDKRFIGAMRRELIRPALMNSAPRLAEAWVDHQARTSKLWPPWVPDAFAQRVDLGDLIRDARRLPNFDGFARSARYQRLSSAQFARIAVLRERTTAKHGIGFADPFADRRLVELVLALPQWQVQRRGRPKHLLHRAVRGVMPELARRQARKNVPAGLFDLGFRERATGIVDGLLTDSRAGAAGWLDEAAARERYQRYVQTGRDTGHDFWWPIVVEWWLRRWWE